MKELTIEQKAKAYDEAIDRAKKWHNAPNADKIPTLSTRVIEEIFPELKESEDEKIRKAIHIYLDWLDGRRDYQPKGEYTIKDMIAWLEKQGELKLKQSDLDVLEKHITKDSISKLAHTVIVRNGWEIVDAKGQKPTSKEDEIKIPFGAKDNELQEATYNIPKGFHAEIDDAKVVIKKGEKPTAWSEEDERMFEYALDMIEWYSGENENKSRLISDWLKSLKQRIV